VLVNHITKIHPFASNCQILESMWQTLDVAVWRLYLNLSLEKK